MVRRYNDRRSRRKQPPLASQNNQGSQLWTILLMGLTFCLGNICYLFFATHYEASPSGSGSDSLRLAGGHHPDDGVHEKPLHLPKKRAGDIGASPAVSLAQIRDEFPDKLQLVEILQQAGYKPRDITRAVVELLPTWSQVTSMIGDAPQIYGMDSCETFRNTIPAEEAFIAPAGIFNSGTNLLAELLIANCYNPARRAKYGTAGVRWQVNWGKHQPPKWRTAGVENYQDKVEMPNENILPVVAVRGPYSWLQSMCRHRYATHWFHEAKLHCPNLVPNEVEAEFYPLAVNGAYKRDRADLHEKDPWMMDNIMNIANYTPGMDAVPVYVKYRMETTNHASLAHFWNDWYRAYYDADFPRIMVRFEDLLFYGKQVTEQACSCIGGKMKNPNNFQHIGDSAKKGATHGTDKIGLVDALVRYGTPTDNARNMTSADLKYARKHLAQDMMDSFAYAHPSRSNR